MGQFCRDADGVEIDSMRYFEDDAGWRDLGLRNRRAPFRFPCCDEALFLSRSRANVPFFSHKKYSPCVGAENSRSDASPGIAQETIEHWTLKHLAAHVSRGLGWQADVEVRHTESTTETSVEPQSWRANCMASHDHRRVVFEILVARQSEADTMERSEMFRKLGILCVWLTTDEANIIVDSKIPLYLVNARNGMTVRSAIERCRRPCEAGDQAAHRPDYDALAEALVARWPVARPRAQAQASFSKTTTLRELFSLAFDNQDELSAESRRHEEEQATQRFARTQSDYTQFSSQPQRRVRTAYAPLERTDTSSRDAARAWMPVVLEVASDPERCATELRRLTAGLGVGRSDALQIPRPHDAAGSRPAADIPSGDYIVQVYATRSDDGPRAITRLSLHRLMPERFTIPQGMPYADPVGDVKFSPHDKTGVSDMLRWFPVFGWASCFERFPNRSAMDRAEAFLVCLKISASVMRVVPWADTSCSQIADPVMDLQSNARGIDSTPLPLVSTLDCESIA